jgi:hypothetical protein
MNGFSGEYFQHGRMGRMATSPQANLLRILAQASHRRHVEEISLQAERMQTQQAFADAQATFVAAAMVVSIAEAEFEILCQSCGSGIPDLKRRKEGLEHALSHCGPDVGRLNQEAADTEQLFLMACRSEVRDEGRLADLRSQAEIAAMRAHECELRTTTLTNALRKVTNDLARKRSESDSLIRRARETLAAAEVRYQEACADRQDYLEAMREVAMKLAQFSRLAG